MSLDKRIRVDVLIFILRKLAPVIEALEFDTPQLRIARTAEGHADFDDTITRFPGGRSIGCSAVSIRGLCRCETRKCASTSGS